MACKECNRNFIGIELDEKYYAIAEERMKEEDQQDTQLSFWDVWKGDIV